MQGGGKGVKEENKLFGADRQELAEAVGQDLTVTHSGAAAEDGLDHPALEGHTVIGGPFGFRVHLLLTEGVGRGHIHNGQVGIGSGANNALAGIEAEGTGRIGGGDRRHAGQRQQAAVDSGEQHRRKTLDTTDTGGGIPEGTVLFLAGVGRVIRADPVQGTIRKTLPDCLAICGGTDERVSLHHRTAAAGVAVGEGQVMGTGLGGDIHAVSLGAAEVLHAVAYAHMEDVQGLFIGGLWLRRIGILITLCFASLAYFWGRKSAERTEALKRLIPKSLCIGTGAVFAVALALIGIISTDFSKYFIVFHKIFFNNDLWVLDPRTDMLINIVPEGFFFDTAAQIALVFAVIVGMFFVGNLVLYKRAGR